jgi:hypothetical protein
MVLGLALCRARRILGEWVAGAEPGSWDERASELGVSASF